MMTWLWIGAVGVVVFVAVMLYRRMGADRIDALAEKRRAASLAVTRGELVDGNRHIAVAMALTRQTLFYENDDMEASLDLEWVHEVEYDTQVATGAAIGDGSVLRLRCSSQSFEFVLPVEAVARWRVMLPARRGLAAGAPIPQYAQ